MIDLILWGLVIMLSIFSIGVGYALGKTIDHIIKMNKVHRQVNDIFTEHIKLLEKRLDELEEQNRKEKKK